MSSRPVASAGPVRVVVCDDSPFMRRFLSDALSGCGVTVVGQAASGREALDLCAAERPDVMTLDMEMPGLGGLDVLRLLPPGSPRVVVVSAHTDHGSALALDALAEGATDVVLKPGLGTVHAGFAQSLANTVRTAALARPATPVRRAPAPLGDRAGAPVRAASADAPLVVIATSTGGPRALAALVPRLREPLGRGGVIVQHMPPGFTTTLARRLDAASPLTIREAVDGDAIEPGVLLLAPGDHHLHVERDRVRLGRGPAIGGLRPRADITLADAARAYGSRVLACVLTGMGSDGVEGVRAVKAAGGRCLAEAEESCVVYGMPRAVVHAGLVDAIHPLDGLPTALNTMVRA